MTRDQLQQRLADLRRMLKARSNTPGYAESVAMIQREIASIVAELAAVDG